jgi:hypothetical protein
LRFQPAWLELTLAEYEAIRAEILTTMETQQGARRFGTAALSILVIGAFNIWKDKLATTLVFLFVVPFVSKLVLTIWIGEVTQRVTCHRPYLTGRFAYAYLGEVASGSSGMGANRSTGARERTIEADTCGRSGSKSLASTRSRIRPPIRQTTPRPVRRG